MSLKSKYVKKMQVKFSKKINKYSEGLTKPESKALKDITKGILSSGTLIVRQIAQSLHEKIKLDKVCERLYRNLKNEKLTDIVSENILKNNSSKATLDTYFLIDESDIIKPESNKLEGLARVRDGSTGKLEKGYHLLNITSIISNGSNYSILPIYSNLYSNKMEQDSSRNMLHDILIDITIHSCNKGIYVFDRGFDGRILFNFLSDNDNSYIIRSTNKRDLIVDGQELKFTKVSRNIERKYDYITDKNKLLKCGVLKVKIRLNPHKVKNPDTVETNLVVARYGKKGGFFYLFCNFKDKTLTDYEIITKALKGYDYRWKIEEYHRHLKLEFNWEKMQLMSYVGLRNLNTIFLIAIDIIYSSIKYTEELLNIYPEYGKIKKKTLKFVYYRLGRILNYIFSNTKLNKITPHKGEYHDKMQLRIKFT